MNDQNRDLLNAFAKLCRNRSFMMAIMNQSNFMSHSHQNDGRGQLRLLQLLAETPAGLTNAEIAEMLDIRPSSVSSMVSRLEAVGQIERVPSENDKRMVIVKISEQGKQMFDQRDKKTEEVADTLFSGLSDEEQVELTKSLAKLDDNMGEINWPNMMRGDGDDRRNWPRFPGWNQGWRF